MGCRVYAHLELDGRPPFSLPVDVRQPAEAQFGTVKQAVLKKFAASFPDEPPVEYNECCFWNQDSCPIADGSPVAQFAWEHNDFFLRHLPGGGGDGSALADSQKKRGELSYYYAHDRGRRQQLISKPQAAETAVAPPRPREPLASGQPVGGGAASSFNTKQSPFGTNINGYETITSYTWEDHDDNTVKVLVPMDGVGKLPPSAVRSSFGERAFELLVDGYDGKNYRFACYKTHGEMKPDECKHVVRANRVNLVLRKAKEKDIWFDLFKKRAVGDTDDP